MADFTDVDLQRRAFRRLSLFGVATFLGHMTDHAHELCTNCGFRYNAQLIIRDRKTTLTIDDMASGSFVAHVKDKNFELKEATYETPT